ncbi:hypothetical protein TFUB4_01549 [Tannerella forsythia]|nr:hypothetical protein TFUB4_01549 [Tannerella forsythia]
MNFDFSRLIVNKNISFQRTNAILECKFKKKLHSLVETTTSPLRDSHWHFL